MTNRASADRHRYHNPNIKGYSYDPAKAKALLAEAGVGSGLKLKFQILRVPLARRSPSR